jgi:hypothetical protein
MRGMEETLSMTPRARGKSERRRHPRAMTDFSAVLNVGTRGYPARVVNLSMGGALLDIGASTPEPAINRGDPVSIDITYATVATPLHVDASAVLWNTANRRVPLLAIQFRDVAEAESELLEHLMTEALVQIRGRATALQIRKFAGEARTRPVRVRE